MTDAPDEIWAIAENEDFSAQTLPDIRAYASPDGLVDKPTKYIRADISQAAVEALKAKLAKAVETLKSYGGVMPVAFTPIQDGGYKARATLAELTGGKDD